MFWNLPDTSLIHYDVQLLHVFNKLGVCWWHLYRRQVNSVPSSHSLFTPRGDIFSQQEEGQVLGILHSYRKGKKIRENTEQQKKKLRREIKSPTRKQPLIRSYRFFSLEHVACRWGSTLLVLRTFPTSFQQGLHSFSSARKSLHFDKREANSQESANHCSRPSKPRSVASGLEMESFRSQPSAAHIPWKFSIRDKAESILFLALSGFLKYFANTSTLQTPLLVTCKMGTCPWHTPPQGLIHTFTNSVRNTSTPFFQNTVLS